MIGTLRSIVRHPLNRNRPVAALARFARWQVASRLLRVPIAMPFVDHTRLLVRNGMTGATGNVYAGLHEVEEMAFTLHLLRPGDGFIDVGANVGSYTVLAAGAAEARCIAVEPVPTTFEALLDNIHLNRLDKLVEPLNIGLGSEAGELLFTGTEDTTNHVLSPEERVRPAGTAVPVAVRTLDHVAGAFGPALIKLDVEGFEYPALSGGHAVLAAPALLAVILETNGSGARYGYDDAGTDRLMREHGFRAARYDPFRRELHCLEPGATGAGNTVYVRDLPEVRRRVTDARQFTLGTGAMI